MVYFLLLLRVMLLCSQICRAPVALKASVARSGARRRPGLLLAAFAASSLLGCGISPRPEPPHSEGPTVDLSSVVTAEPITFDIFTLRGLEGAVKPPEGIVRAYNLEVTDPPAEAAVESDGGFELSLVAVPGDELRLQVIAGARRSLPSDFIVGPVGTAVQQATRALGDCLLLEPRLELELVAATAAAISVDNGCELDVQLLAPAVRSPWPELTLGQQQTWPATLGPGDSLSLDVLLSETTTITEEIIFIEATAPESDRRPVTVRLAD
jgi:hypothetical protein